MNKGESETKHMVEATVVPQGLCMTYRALLDKYINRAKRFG